MTADQENHLESVKTWFLGLVDPKYRKGQREHGGNLWMKPVIPMIIEETVDFSVYVCTLQEQQRQLVILLDEAIERADWGRVAMARELVAAQLAPPVD